MSQLNFNPVPADKNNYRDYIYFDNLVRNQSQNTQKISKWTQWVPYDLSYFGGRLVKSDTIASFGMREFVVCYSLRPIA